MRQESVRQSNIFGLLVSQHDKISREMKHMSEILDKHPELNALVLQDMRVGNKKNPNSDGNKKNAGRHGLSAETILRCAILKQGKGLSYIGLVHALGDSASCAAFARLPTPVVPSKTVLHDTISAITDETWAAVNKVILNHAKVTGIEDGSKIRIDSTVVESLIHEPSDNSLLWDSVRVMTRLLKEFNALPGAKQFDLRKQAKTAKRRNHAIQNAKTNERRKELYKELVAITYRVVASIKSAHAMSFQLHENPLDIICWRSEVEHYLPLIACVIDQCERRVFNDEKVPAAEKIFSIFEDHTDVIIKDRRGTNYGHKVNICAGNSSLILNVNVEDGNPADSKRFLPMLEQHIEQYGCAPQHVACDGGYASAENLAEAKSKGVTNMAFHKKRGLNVDDMCANKRTYRKLRNFRAGIESNISCLKRAFGWTRCTWRGIEHFRAYLWSAAVAYNLALLARLSMS